MPTQALMIDRKPKPKSRSPKPLQYNPFSPGGRAGGPSFRVLCERVGLQPSDKHRLKNFHKPL